MGSPKKIQSLKDTLEKIKNELKTLDQFRPTKQLVQFRRRLAGEYSHVKRQLSILENDSKTEIEERKRSLRAANRNRREKNKRTWRFHKSISKNYGIPIQKVRKEWKKRRENLESDVDDTIWRNPSP
jgi:ATP-dependent Clp protease ATP-binding subunit ClpA